MRLIGRITIIALISMIPFLTTDCRSSHSARKQREISKIQEQRAGETAKQYEKAVQRHLDIQTKETRKKIKKSLKEAKKQNRRNKKSFWQRLFGKNCK